MTYEKEGFSNWLMLDTEWVSLKLVVTLQISHCAKSSKCSGVRLWLENGLCRLALCSSTKHLIVLPAPSLASFLREVAQKRHLAQKSKSWSWKIALGRIL